MCHCHFFILYNNYNKNFYKNQLRFLSGAEGVRTLDLLRARQALSHPSELQPQAGTHPRALRRTFSGWVGKYRIDI